MLRVTISSSSGCTAPAATAVASGGAGSEIQPITSAYEAVDNFVIDIKFEGKYEVITEGALDPITGLAGDPTVSYIYQNAKDVTSVYDWASIGLTMSKPNVYTVRLTGPSMNVFPDQYYKFVLTDFTQEVLPADTTTPFLSIVRYHKPSVNSVTLSYPFTVTIPTSTGGTPNTSETVNVPQDFWWSFPAASANISRLKGQGLK